MKPSRTGESRPVTVPDLHAMKQAGRRLAMLTAYDAGFARVMDVNGVDLILVGDSLGMVVQGQANTLGVTVDDIAYHVGCVSRAVQRWLTDAGIDTVLNDPGKPWQNGTAESFNGKFRDECLSMEWFRNRTEAKVVIEQWRQHYNEVRPHSSLGNQTPAAFKKQCFSTTQPEAVFQE